MSVHIERTHHRPRVWQKYGNRWVAHCDHCGWSTPTWLHTQHEAFVIALAHAESSLR